MPAVHMKIVSKNGTVVCLSRDVQTVRDAIEAAFEHACADPEDIVTIDMEDDEEQEQE